MTGLLLAAAMSIEAALTNGASFLLGCQAEDGHWSDPQMPALTALPLWALSGCATMDGVRERLADGALRRAADYVLKTQRA